MPSPISDREVTCPKCNFSIVLDLYDGAKRTTLLSMARCLQCQCYRIQKTHQCPNCLEQFSRQDITYCSGKCKIQSVSVVDCYDCNKVNNSENCRRCSRPTSNKRMEPSLQNQIRYNELKRNRPARMESPSRNQQLYNNVQQFNNLRLITNRHENFPFRTFPLITAYANNMQQLYNNVQQFNNLRLITNR